MAEKKPNRSRKRKALFGDTFETEMKKKKVEKNEISAAPKTKVQDNYKLVHMKKIYQWLTKNSKIQKLPEEKESIHENMMHFLKNGTKGELNRHILKKIEFRKFLLGKFLV